MDPNRNKEGLESRYEGLHPLDIALQEFEELSLEERFNIYKRAGLVSDDYKVTKEYGGEGEYSVLFKKGE